MNLCLSSWKHCISSWWFEILLIAQLPTERMHIISMWTGQQSKGSTMIWKTVASEKNFEPWHWKIFMKLKLTPEKYGNYRDLRKNGWGAKNWTYSIWVPDYEMVTSAFLWIFPKKDKVKCIFILFCSVFSMYVRFSSVTFRKNVQFHRNYHLLLFISSALYINRHFVPTLEVSLLADSATLPVFQNQWL